MSDCMMCVQALARGIGDGPPCEATVTRTVTGLDGEELMDAEVCDQCAEWIDEGMPMAIGSEPIEPEAGR